MNKEKFVSTQLPIEGDCLTILNSGTENTYDIVITSPPYNINLKYKHYKDNMKREKYLEWIESVFLAIKRTLKNNGSIFLNVGSTNTDPWIAIDVANVLRKHFVLQNDIIWIKSITINKTTVGHFKPINSKRFLNYTFEHIFHFTKEGNIAIDRKAIGVPYTDKSNIKRWKGKIDKRCRGNVWYIPYSTIQNKSEKGHHPAIFPNELVEMCIKLHGYNNSTEILDPFAGTGTVLKVAKQLNINADGIEIDPDYIKYIKKTL